MKTLKFKLLLVVFGVVAILFSSCMTDKFEEMKIAPNYTEFDFNTINEFNVAITTLNNANQAMSGVNVKLYTQYPLNSDGTLRSDCESFLIYSGSTNDAGVLECVISPPTTVDSLSILVNQIGLPSIRTVKLIQGNIQCLFGGTSASNAPARVKSAVSAVATLPVPTIKNGYYVLGAWDSQGVPSYLSSPNDVISNSLLADINSSLPEYKSLTVSHPQYLEDSNDGSLKLYAAAEVWVTFIHEGAGWTNALAYYTYPNGNPPATASAIADKTVIFPNVSFNGSGGGLTSGNKVQLLYLNPVTKLYSTIFPAGTTVSWILIAQGWNASTRSIQSGYCTHYSDSRFNAETDSKLKKHNVILNDPVRQLLLIGFEDMRRDNGADNDFNDAVFYATTNPYSAIQQSQYKAIDSPTDTDKDGVTDENDEYPSDEKKVHNNYYPAKAQKGSLAFEDLWPSKGDYDFNDLVVDYNFNQITNARNQIVAVDAQLTVRAIGASYHNAFGIQFNTTPENVRSVSGQLISKDYLKIAANGTENNQNKAVIIVFDDAFNALPYPGEGVNVNTIKGNPYATPQVINLNIKFVTPIDPATFGSAPYNPFIIINRERGREVHLSASAPTSLADLSLLGTGDDNSNVGAGKFYMSDKYLPWAINLPVPFDYPAEKEDITKAYRMFNNWAVSRGNSNVDWYGTKNGYRDATKIYSK